MSITFSKSAKNENPESRKNTSQLFTRGRIFTGFGILVVVTLLAYAIVQARTPSSTANITGTGVETSSPLVGTVAPKFALPSLIKATQLYSLSEFAGKPAVLNFFSPACIPCRAELPTFASLGQQYQGKINFLGIDETSSSGAAISLVKADHVKYPVVIDANGDLVGPYLIPGVPVTVFIGANGIVRGYIAGAISKATLISQTQQLL